MVLKLCSERGDVLWESQTITDPSDFDEDAVRDAIVDILHDDSDDDVDFDDESGDDYDD